MLKKVIVYNFRNTAYFGLLEICKPQSDETVVVTGAAGAVGSIVGQIAKIKGCTVIGITGSAEKEQWLKGLNFDYVLNHKDEKFKEKLSIITPNGVDCFFDNIGGEINPIVIARMNKFGRISICGGSAAYNKTNPDKGIDNVFYLSIKKFTFSNSYIQIRNW